jgi:hypothetical protein
MEIGRKILCSLHQYIGTELTASGWSSVNLVKQFPDDESKILFSGSEVGSITIPAVCLAPSITFEGSATGIGMDTHAQTSSYLVLIYAKTDGQEMDLRQFLAKQIYRCPGVLYNFPSGYPGTGVEESAVMRFNNIRHRPIYDISNSNVALRYAGIISFNILTETI